MAQLHKLKAGCCYRSLVSLPHRAQDTCTNLKESRDFFYNPDKVIVTKYTLDKSRNCGHSGAKADFVRLFFFFLKTTRTNGARIKR